MKAAGRDALAVILWSAFWLLVIAGLLAIWWEWKYIGPMLGL
jgi:hypothetical protein